MAAKHPEVSRAIRTSLGRRPERGTLARLAEAVGVKAPTVTRWYKLESSPDPSLWVAIEEHLDLHAGALERSVGAVELDAPTAAGGAATVDQVLGELRALRADMDRSAKNAVRAIEKTHQDLERLETMLARQRAGRTARQTSATR